MRKLLTIIVILILIAVIIQGCASIMNPGRADRPEKAVSKRVDGTALACDISLIIVPVAIDSKASGFISLTGVGFLVYDFLTGNIYTTAPSYRSKYPDRPKK